ncbi:hypothetical protein Trydic_g808 [Trypoxylus dichotomus]
MERTDGHEVKIYIEKKAAAMPTIRQQGPIQDSQQSREKGDNMQLTPEFRKMGDLPPHLKFFLGANLFETDDELNLP